MASLNESLFGGTPLDLVHEWFSESVTYTTAEGTESTVSLFFKFFVGALDNRENAVVEVKADEVANPNEGDFFVRSGETARWYVNDVRERANYFQLRVIRTKERS